MDATHCRRVAGGAVRTIRGVHGGTVLGRVAKAKAMMRKDRQRRQCTLLDRAPGRACVPRLDVPGKRSTRAKAIDREEQSDTHVIDRRPARHEQGPQPGTRPQPTRAGAG